MFGKRLTDRGFAKEHRHCGMVYLGIGIRSNDNGSREKE
jgi:hypothetical protein